MTRNGGEFRSWLLTVVRSKFHNFPAQEQRRPALAGPEHHDTLAM
jgi:DNA-directed RNA polymerase specialized sigma24 family protein